MHDALLDQRFILFEFDDLPLHVFVFVALSVDLVRQVVEVRHDERINDFYVLVVLSRKMVLHKSNLLTKHFNFFFVFSELALGLHYNVLFVCYLNVGTYLYAFDALSY